MWRNFCGWLLRTLGWTVGEGTAPEKICIILGVPHTSIMDFVISYLYYTSVGGKFKCMVKKEAFVWPVGPILRAMGAVPVDRSNSTSLMVSLIHEMEKADTFHLVLAPEGTRKPVRKWKTGFHTIARQVGCPVYLGYFDWKNKKVGRGQKVELTENAREDMNRIQGIYEQMNLTGKHPEMYVTH